jgi:glycosyltransferase involved in cell wall biosynthesis
MELSSLKEIAVHQGAPFVGYFTLDHYPLDGYRQSQILDDLFSFIIPVTFYEKKLAAEHLSKCKVMEPVPYGVDHDTYNPNSWAATPLGKEMKASKHFKVLYVGSGSPYKDLGRWYRVVGEVARRGVPVKGILKLSSAIGSSSMPASVSVLEDVNQLSGKVQYVLGWLDDRELAALVSACDVFLTLSTAEGFCLAALEAQACGLPVVLPDIPQLREVYGDSALYVKREGTWYSGLGCRYVTSSAEDAVEKLLLLYEDANLREEMRSKSLANAKRYSWDACAAKIVEVFEGITRK